MENASGAKERYKENERTDKAVVEFEGSNVASGRDQGASDHIYEEPLKRTYPSLPAEIFYDIATGRSKLFQENGNSRKARKEAIVCFR